MVADHASPAHPQDAPPAVPAALHPSLLAAFLDGHQSPETIAADHGLSVEALIDYYDSEPFRQSLERRESLSLSRARAILADAYPTALQVLAETVADHDAPPYSRRSASHTLTRLAQNPGTASLGRSVHPLPTLRPLQPITGFRDRCPTSPLGTRHSALSTTPAPVRERTDHVDTPLSTSAQSEPQRAEDNPGPPATRPPHHNGDSGSTTHNPEFAAVASPGASPNRQSAIRIPPSAIPQLQSGPLKDCWLLAHLLRAKDTS